MKELEYTHLEINISNLKHNLAYFKSFLPPTEKLLVLVKAYGYGHGAGEFSKILEKNGIDYLAVASPQEGVEIRKAGVKLPIIVLSGGCEHFPLLMEYNLEPSIPTLESFLKFVATAREMGKKEYPVHIKLDTGMHRLGFELPGLGALIDELPSPYAHIASVFTHFVASGDPVHDDFTRQQIAIFEEGSSAILKALPYRPLRHILNSPGIERFAKEAAYDMARLGIGLYGMSYVDRTKLKPTAFLRTPVLQVRTINAGETVGYGRAGKIVSGPAKIATLAIGYADGVNRRLSVGRASFMVNGQLAPTVGNICMDMCMIDVTGIDVKEGDMVTIFGENPSIFTLAETLGTIPYEILTSVAYRVPRVYVD